MMLKNTIYIITIFILVFFATSCCPSKTIKIEDKDKLQIYENDMFIYKSNLGNYDTLFIEEVVEETPLRDKATVGLCNHTKIYKQQFKYFFNNYTEQFPEDSLLYLTLIYSQYEDTLNYRLGYSGNNSYTGVFSVGSGGSFINTYYLGDSIYTDVRNIYAGSNPKKFFINSKYGILSYEYPTKEVFALYKYVSKN